MPTGRTDPAGDLYTALHFGAKRIDNLLLMTTLLRTKLYIPRPARTAVARQPLRLVEYDAGDHDEGQHEQAPAVCVDRHCHSLQVMRSNYTFSPVGTII